MQPAPPDMMGPGPGMMGPGLMGPSMGPGAVGAGIAHAPAHRAENFHHVAPPKRLRVGGYRAPLVIVPWFTDRQVDLGFEGCRRWFQDRMPSCVAKQSRVVRIHAR